MNLKIITPEAVLYNGLADAVIVPGVEGEFEVLNNHAPIVSLLTEGTIRIKGDMILKPERPEREVFKINNQNETQLKINSGTIEVIDNDVTLIVE